MSAQVPQPHGPTSLADHILQYGGTTLAMSGTLVMALAPNTSWQIAAWSTWTTSSILLCAWAIKRRAWGILALNLFYIAVDSAAAIRLLLH